MSSDQKLIKYFLKHKKEILNLLDRPAKLYTALHYHKLRVEIKKLEALFRLIRAGNKKFHKAKSGNLLKDIFKQAGKIREIQLEQAMLKKKKAMHGLTSYYSLLNIELQQEHLRFAWIKNKDWIRHVKKRLTATETYFSEIENKSVKNHIHKEENKIRDLLHVKRLKPGQVHKLRKRMKAWYYNSKSLNMDDKKNRFNRIKQFMEQLGKWHDYRVLDDRLQKAISENKLKGAISRSIIQVRKKAVADAASILEKINASRADLHVKSSR
jgi:CHAD domain-containing protein